MSADPMELLPQIADRAANALARQSPPALRQGVLAAVSGGADSTALAVVLAELQREGRLGGPLTLGHVRHGASPHHREAAAAVTALAERLRLPLLDGVIRAATPRSEGALRDARYAGLADMAVASGAGIVCTAHHADDQLETIVFRLVRGTGPAGLAGIPEARRLGALWLVRPLLEERGTTLRQLLAAHGESWVEDPTNRDHGPSRNRIRRELLPELRDRLGPGFAPSLLALGRAARAVTGALGDGADRLLAAHGHEVTSWRLELDALPAADQVFLEEALRRTWRRLRAGTDAPWSWVERARDIAVACAGQRVAGPGELLVERTRSGLLVVDPERAGSPPDRTLELPEGGTARRFGGTEWRLDAVRREPSFARPKAGPLRVFVDPRSAPTPWRLRTRRSGDRFHPPGLPGPVLLRTFLINRHVPRFDRDRLPLVVDARGELLWVPGVALRHGASARGSLPTCVELRASRAD